MVREPSVAGQFYPGAASSLKKEVHKHLHEASKEKVIGVVAPHAGYMYSGPVAGSVYSAIEIPDTIVILGPNHTGAGKRFALYEKGAWNTPLGDVEIDSDLASDILKTCEYLELDTKAHVYEHSLEVQVPFLQCLKTDFKIVPIVLAGSDMAAYKNLGAGLAASITKLKKRVLIVASSDMSHHESQDAAKKKDKIAIDAILALDEERLIKDVEGKGISMCGYIPTAVMLIAAKALGAKEAKLIKYQTSGDVTGDYADVVGYAGLIVK